MPDPILEDENTEIKDPALEGEEDQNGNTEEIDPGEENIENEENQEGSKKDRGEIRHERYIEKLHKEIRLGNEQSARYEDNLFGPTKPYEPLPLKEGAEYDPAQLEEDRTKVANSKFAEGFQRGTAQSTSLAILRDFDTKLDIDKDRVATKWAVLDPERPESYNPKLEERLVQKYIEFTGMTKDDKGIITIQRPNVRFKDFIDAEMLDREEYASTKGAQSSRNIEGQANKTSVRPSGQTPAPKKGHGFDPNDPAGSVKRMTNEQYFKLGGKEASDAYLKARGLA